MSKLEVKKLILEYSVLRGEVGQSGDFEQILHNVTTREKLCNKIASLPKMFNENNTRKIEAIWLFYTEMDHAKDTREFCEKIIRLISKDTKISWTEIHDNWLGKFKIKHYDCEFYYETGEGGTLKFEAVLDLEFYYKIQMRKHFSENETSEITELMKSICENLKENPENPNERKLFSVEKLKPSEEAHELFKTIAAYFFHVGFLKYKRHECTEFSFTYLKGNWGNYRFKLIGNDWYFSHQKLYSLKKSQGDSDLESDDDWGSDLESDDDRGSHMGSLFTVITTMHQRLNYLERTLI